MSGSWLTGRRKLAVLAALAAGALVPALALTLGGGKAQPSRLDMTES